jgi:ParB family transcriptional regulator, chromosome partitioning protein
MAGVCRLEPHTERKRPMMNLTPQTQTIALNRLVRSKSNVRRTARDTGIDALMASIAAHGLRQNLNVRATSGNRFEVVAGGRRLEALRRLAKDGTLPADAAIPCAVLAENDNAAEISLAENAIRQDMHPDDQCDAFAALIASGSSIEDIAARFGVTPILVRQRLKLAAVSPTLRKLFRKGDLDLSQMSAFALVDDHAAQEAVWADLPEWNRDGDAIRRALSAEGVEATERLAAFVGIDAYEAAGGTVLRDLFDTDQPAILADGDLVERLAMRRLEEEAAHVQSEGWSWVKIELKPDYMTAYGRIYPVPSDDETAEPVFAPADIARAGARVRLGHDGDLLIERGLVSPATIKAEKKKAQGSDSAPKSLPETLVADLTAHRTAALRLALSSRPDIALASTVHAMALSLLYHPYGVASCLDLNGTSARLEVRDAGECGAHDALTTQQAAWQSQLPEHPKELWDWCLVQDQTLLLELLAFLAALSVDAVTRRESDGTPRIRHADQLAQALSLDMAEHWSPSADGFVARLSKAQMATALKEAGKPEQAEIVIKLGKVEAATRTAKHLAGTGWLPEPMKITAHDDHHDDGDNDDGNDHEVHDHHDGDDDDGDE